MAHDALLALYEEVEKVTRPVYERYGNFWPCREGCSDCCFHSAFLVSATEFTFITEGMIGMMTRDERRAAYAQARSELSRYHQAVGYGRWPDLTERFNERELVCPLLDEPRGACMLYEHRPLICRVYGVVALTDGKKRPYGCRKVASEMARQIVGGTDIVLPDFADIEKLMTGVLKAPLRPLVAWLGEV